MLRISAHNCPFWVVVRMMMHRQNITTISIQSHENPSPHSIHMEELLVLLSEGRMSVKVLFYQPFDKIFALFTPSMPFS